MDRLEADVAEKACQGGGRELALPASEPATKGHLDMLEDGVDVKRLGYVDDDEPTRLEEPMVSLQHREWTAEVLQQPLVEKDIET